MPTSTPTANAARTPREAARSVAAPVHGDARDVAATLRLTVTRLARILRQQSDTGLTPTQLAALATLDRTGAMPIGALADEEQIGAPTATKIVDKLQGAGYVERQSDPSDRRVTRVAITPAGRALLETTRARKTAWLSTRLAALSDDEVQTLAAALPVLQALTSPTTTKTQT